MCPSAYNAEAVPFRNIFFKERFSYARCGSDDEDIHIPFVCNNCWSQSYRKSHEKAPDMTEKADAKGEGLNLG